MVPFWCWMLRHLWLSSRRVKSVGDLLCPDANSEPSDSNAHSHFKHRSYEDGNGNDQSCSNAGARPLQLESDIWTHRNCCDDHGHRIRRDPGGEHSLVQQYDRDGVKLE